MTRSWGPALSPREAFTYQPEEWQTILACCSHLCPSDRSIEVFRAELGILFVDGALSDSEQLSWHEHALRTARESVAAIDALVLNQSPRIGLPHRNFVGAVVEDVVATTLAKCMPDLLQMREELIREMEVHSERIFAWSQKTGSNARPFAAELMKRSASFWTRAGGQISHSSEYKAFFTAIVRPALTDPNVMRVQKCGWTEGMFRTHVASTMKLLRVPGKRGPKPKLSAPHL